MWHVRDELNIQQILPALESCERRIRNRHRFRWVRLTLAAILLSLCVYFAFSIQSLSDQFDSAAREFGSAKLSDFLVGHVRLVEAQSNMHFGVLFSGAIGTFLLIGTLAMWRGRPADTVMIACLREMLASLDQRGDEVKRSEGEHGE